MESEDNNRVSQINNIVENGDIAGRDIHKNIFNIHLYGKQDYESLIQNLKNATGIPESILRNIITRKNLDEYGTQALESGLALLEITKGTLVSGLINDIKGEYERLVLGDLKNNLDEEYLKGIISAAAIHIRKLEFDKAHRLFESALSELSSSDKNYSLIFKEYLVTGFIHYSRHNDMNGLKSLLRKKKSTAENEDPTIDTLIANIFQEVCSRDTDLQGVEKAVSMLERIYKKAPDKMRSSMANSLGLAYRRLGERTNTSYLEKAVEIFKEGLKMNDGDNTMEVQLKDQMAITLVRIFEFTQKEEYLNESEKLLKDCLEILKSVHDPRDCMLQPRVMNNIGNVFKQRVLAFDDFSSATKAIAYYEEAGKFWIEKDSGYEWGILKKNIGETKYALGCLNQDPALLVEALENCMASMKYRDIQNSPYQWAKSVEIMFKAIVELEKERSI